MTSEQPRTGRRTLIGTVVSDKMEKTVVVEVTRRVLHGRYHKYMTRRKKYKAHDETNAILTGAELNSEIEHASPHGKAPGQKNAQGKLLIGARAARAFRQRQNSRPPTSGNVIATGPRARSGS